MRLALPIALVVVAMVPGCFSAEHSPLERLSFAEALVWGDPFPELAVHVWYPEDTVPDPAALDTMIRALHDETDKGTIRLVGPHPYPSDDEAANSPRMWTLVGLMAWSDRYAMVPQDERNGTVHLSVFYVRGSLEKGYEGYSTGARIFVVPDAYRGIRVGEPQEYAAAVIERAVLVHEVGHSMGLVNAGAPMLVDRDDGTRHSLNEGSVMRHHDASTLASIQENAVENSAIPYRFDADDRADLAAFRDLGRARLADLGRS